MNSDVDLEMELVEHPDMPKSNGHYSQCIKYNGILYLSGQLPICTRDKKIPDNIEEQADLVFKNIENILHCAGSSKNKVLQVRIYIPDIALWDIVNERFKIFFGDHKPARCIIPTGALHYNCLIEIEITAIA